jgi:DNA repair exonuclease SbcCD ATPase subunit
MKINKIEIKNFYSIKNIVLSFDKLKGLVVIQGKNKDTGGSNGSGKSALIEAVVWGIFGRTIRKSTEEALVNLYSKRACVVRITLNENVVIERGKKPTFLKFFVGEEERTGENALDTQKIIEGYLKTNYKVFLASTIFGQQNNIDFISSTPEDKRIIIKNFLNLDKLFALRDSVKYLKSKVNSSIKEKDTIIREHNKTLAGLDKKIKIAENLKKKISKNYSEDILKLSLADIIKLEGDNQSLGWQRAGIEKEIEVLEEQADELVYKVSQGKRTNSEVCDKCGNLSIKKVTDLDLDTWDHDLGVIVKEIKKYKKSIKKIDKDRVEVPISSQEYSTIQEYQTLSKELETFDTFKEETFAKINQAEEEKQSNNNNYQIMRFWEKAFSESGLVKYIIRNILGFLNGKANYFLSHLTNGKFTIEFDEELKEVIKSGGKQVHYISLSGGEKRKISLSVMLALQSLVGRTHTSECNLMFFDEVAENLDKDGLEGLYILLSELKKTKTLFIITHNNYLKSLINSSRTLTITKSKGISTLNRR